jgi:hypothetical protein
MTHWWEVYKPCRQCRADRAHEVRRLSGQRVYVCCTCLLWSVFP